MKSLKKQITVLILVLLAVLCFPLSLTAETIKETDSGIFYSIENGEVTVEGFNDVGTVMKVPKEIEGCPVVSIAPYACRSNTSLTEVQLPTGLLTVGDFAFADCPNLLKVTLGGAETIGRSAFRSCGALLSVSLPSSLLIIDDNAFADCVMLGKVTIPASVTTIGVDAFAGCSRLRLDVSKNLMAKDYAERYAIPTSFTETWEFTLLMLALVTVLLGGALLLVSRLFKKKKSSTK